MAFWVMFRGFGILIYFLLGFSEMKKAESLNWAAVKEFNSSCYIGETLLFATYANYGNLTYVP